MPIRHGVAFQPRFWLSRFSRTCLHLMFEAALILLSKSKINRGGRHETLLRRLARALLLDAGKGELAVAHALGQTLGEARHRFFAISRDEFLEGGEESGIRHAIAVDAVEDRLFPGLQKIVERRPASVLEFEPGLEGRQTILHDSLPRRGPCRSLADHTMPGGRG